MFNGREKVTTDDERVLITEGRLNRDQVVKISRLSGCENFNM